MNITEKIGLVVLLLGCTGLIKSESRADIVFCIGFAIIGSSIFLFG